MEIRKATYELCKLISTLPERPKLANLISSMGNSQLGYYGHRQYAQVLGYLMVNQERANFDAKPFPEHIQPLPVETLKTLAGIHKRIVDLNQRCVKAITDKLPRCSFRVLSPYNRFAYVAPNDIPDLNILTDQQTNELVEAFQSHPKVAIALESSTSIPPTFSEEHYMQNVWALEEDIKKGRLERPKELQELKFKVPKDAPRRIVVRHIAAVMSVRASLSVLNQLIYQKLFYDKLLVIDENNTIRFGSFHLESGCGSAIFQHAGLLYVMEVGDIVLLKTVLLHTPVSKLCRVEFLDPHIPLLDFGEPRYSELREVNENLDPYHALFHNF